MSLPNKTWVEIKGEQGGLKYAQDGFIYEFFQEIDPLEGYDMGFLYECEVPACLVKIRVDEKDGVDEIKNKDLFRRHRHPHPPDYREVLRRIKEARNREKEATANQQSQPNPVQGRKKKKNKKKANKSQVLQDVTNNNVNNSTMREGTKTSQSPNVANNCNSTNATTTTSALNSPNPKMIRKRQKTVLVGNNNNVILHQQPSTSTASGGPSRSNLSSNSRNLNQSQRTGTSTSLVGNKPGPKRTVKRLVNVPAPQLHINQHRPLNSSNAGARLQQRVQPSAPPLADVQSTYSSTPQRQPFVTSHSGNHIYRQRSISPLFSPRFEWDLQRIQQIEEDERFARQLAAELSRPPPPRPPPPSSLPSSPSTQSSQQSGLSIFGRLFSFLFSSSPSAPIQRNDIGGLSDSECTICLEIVRNEAKCTGCRQVIGCRPCVQRWIQNQVSNLQAPSCPLCRTVLRGTEYRVPLW